ncbi:MAG: hypothetical protein ACK6AD_01775 [Cyanobacteriota bacterium]
MVRRWPLRVLTLMVSPSPTEAKVAGWRGTGTFATGDGRGGEESLCCG